MINLFRITILRYLQIFCRNINHYINGILLFIVLLASIAYINQQMLVDIVLSIILVFGVIIASSNANYIIADDYRNGVITQIYLQQGYYLEVFILTKIIIHTVLQYLLFAISIPLIWLFFNIPWILMSKFLAVYFFLLLFTNLFITFASTLNLALGAANLGVLLVMPFLFPIIVISIISLHDLKYLILISGLLLLLIPILIILAKSLIKIIIYYD